MQAEDNLKAALHKDGRLPGDLQRIIISDDAARALNTPGIKRWLGKNYLKLKDAVGGERAFSLSMQAQVYQMMHTGIVLERSTTVFKAFESFKQHKNRVRFEDDIKLAAYDPSDVTKFNSLVAEGSIQKAADYLSIASSHGIIGMYGAATHPLGYGGTVGRLVAQYGQWPSWMLGVLEKQLTGPQGVKVLGKMSMIMGATMAAGAVTGANLSSWIVAPQNLQYSGGPLVQLGVDAMKGNLSRYLPWQGELGNGATLQPRQLYVPVPFAAWNLLAGMGIYNPNEHEKSMIEDDPFLGILKGLNLSITPWNQGLLPIPSPNKVNLTVPINQQAKDTESASLPNIIDRLQQ